MNTVGYSKTSQHAISAISYLASNYADPSTRTSSSEIAQARGLSQTIVAKILTILSQADLVVGSPGPSGGYRLAREPESITFFDVVNLFDSKGTSFPCPFGADYCPNDNPCPLHDELINMRERVGTFLEQTHFGKFAT